MGKTKVSYKSILVITLPCIVLLSAGAVFYAVNYTKTPEIETQIQTQTPVPVEEEPLYTTQNVTVSDEEVENTEDTLEVPNVTSGRTTERSLTATKQSALEHAIDELMALTETN